MRNNKTLPFLILTLVQVGCAENPVYQKPAPVYRSHPVVRQQAPKPLETYQYPEEVVATPPPKAEEYPEPQEPNSISAIEPLTPPEEPSTTPEPEPTLPPEEPQNPPIEPVAPVAPPEPPPMPPLSTDSFSPPILALSTEADQSIQAGQYDSAAVKIERALRIDPRNAVLTYKLATIRLQQEKPRLAEDLAKKAALLAGSDRDIKKRSWLLIAESKRRQNDPEGAQKAQEKALQF